MYQNFILDGGMGQALLDRGMTPNGSLWSASALVNSDLHKLVEDLHIDYINAGSNVIITSNFTVRDRRLLENNILDQKYNLLKIASDLALSAVNKTNKKVLIGGSLPTQGETYKSDIYQSKEEMTKSFYETANILNQNSDFFYLDVLCSIEEINVALDSIKNFNKPILIGAHFRINGLLPSGESIFKLKSLLTNYNIMGVIGACVSPEIYHSALPDLSSLGVPYGFKVNAFKKIPSTWSKSTSSNPNEVLGVRNDFTPEVFRQFVQKEISDGATIVGGCCETYPEHISAISD